MQPGRSAGGDKRQTGLNKAPMHLTHSESALILCRPEGARSPPRHCHSPLGAGAQPHTRGLLTRPPPGSSPSRSWTPSLVSVLSSPWLPNPTQGLALSLPLLGRKSELLLDSERPHGSFCGHRCSVLGTEGRLGLLGRWTSPVGRPEPASYQNSVFCTGPRPRREQ